MMSVQTVWIVNMNLAHASIKSMG